jgi:glycosyltransferase involved in cell wall biosynthesis
LDLKNSKLVSVIIPFFNRLDLVMSSVRSVVDQSYRPIELILVDDCSTEQFDLKFVDSFITSDLNIKLIRNKRNLGPGTSREMGRLIAKGDYIAYLDSDDFWHKNFIEKLVKKLEECPEAGMAYSKTLLIRSTGNYLRNKNDKIFDHIIPIIFDVHGRPWATSSCVWRRSTVNKIGPWSDARMWEDYEYDVRAAICNNNIIHVPEVLFYMNMESKQKISMVKNTKAMIAEKAKSILSIARHLRNSQFRTDPDIRRRIVYYLLTSCAALSDFSADKTAIKNLFKEYNIWKGTNLSVVALMTAVAPSKINSKLFRKIRQFS